MKTASLAERARAFAATFALLAFFAVEGRAFADEPTCPACESLTARIEFHYSPDKFTLEIEAFSGFDPGDFDSVELMFEEGSTTEYASVNFGVGDLEDPIWEQHSTPSGITGVETDVYLRFYIDGTSYEVLVPVTVE